jgi:hypothetical protein
MVNALKVVAFSPKDTLFFTILDPLSGGEELPRVKMAMSSDVLA